VWWLQDGGNTGCNRKGHIQRDCPDNEERETATSSNLTMTVEELLTTPDEGDFDGDDPTEYAFVIERGETVLFSDTTVSHARSTDKAAKILTQTSWLEPSCLHHMVDRPIEHPSS
jgi:hypothetical protein